MLRTRRQETNTVRLEVNEFCATNMERTRRVNTTTLRLEVNETYATNMERTHWLKGAFFFQKHAI